MSIGMKGMLHGVKALSLLGLWLLRDPKHITQAKAEFEEKMRGRQYECALPAGARAPEPETRG